MERALPKIRISRRALRIAAVVGVLIAIWVIAWSTGILSYVDVESVRAWVAQWGLWGVLVFVVVACLCNLAHIPGMVPIVAAILAFGDVTGAFVGWFGATVAAAATFATMRAIGGRGTAEVNNKLLRRLLGGLEARPVWTIAILRALFQNSPILNTALALSPVSFRGYILGSALGLMAPVAVAAVFTGWFT